MSDTLDKKLSVKGVVKDSLVRNKVDSDEPFKNLGADRSDVADIFYKLDLKFNKYVSGGKLSNKGINKLKDMDIYSGEKTDKEFVNNLTINKLQKIKNYKPNNL